MIVALCPLDNAFDTAANVAAIDAQLERAAVAGAALAVFPECGLTGYKPRQDLSHAHIADALARVQASVARHGVSALVPSIELDRSTRPRNRARLFAAAKMRGCARAVNAPLLQANFRRPEQNPARQNIVVMGGSLAVAPDRTLLHPFEPHRREPLLVAVHARSEYR